MATKKNMEISTSSGAYSYYKITRTIGHKYKDGKKVPIKKQFYGTSKGNAEKKYNEYLKQQAAADNADASNYRTFGELAEDFTYNILTNSSYAYGTKRRYEQSYRVHVKDSWLSSMPISEVKSRTIQDYYNSLPVSKQTLKAITKWMAAFYKYLSLNEISENVLPAVTLPEKEDHTKKRDIIVWEPEELQHILTASEGHRLSLLMYIMAYSGLRISEGLGLKYEDLDDGFVCVNRQYYMGQLSDPKHRSFRKVPMHHKIESALETHKTRFSQEAKENHYKTDFVFTTNTGKLIEYANARRSLSRFYKRNNIPDKSPHVYRATFCTELCRSGVPLEVASKLMGHSSVEVTAKHYALIKQDVQTDAINRLP